MTHVALNFQFADLEKQRAELLEKLERYDDKVLNKKPRPEAWSVIEVLHHLIVAEQSTVKYLRKKTQDRASAQKTGVGESLRLLMLKTALYLPIKFKVPETAVPTLTYATLAETEALWATTREDMQEVWMQMPEDILDRNWFKHPFAGKLGFKQMLEFLDCHISRHEQQIWRTLKEVSK